MTEAERIIAHPMTAHGRVLAGPGTGKTTTAAKLAEQLLGRAPAPRVKFLTFTRIAAGELIDRLRDQGGMERPSTIHSFSISTLLRNPGCGGVILPLKIPDDYEYSMLIRPHLARILRMKSSRVELLVREMGAKWESLNPEERQEITARERARFMGAWNQHRQTFGYTLLAEIPNLLREALHNHPDLDGLGYQLLVVDEYQDLNPCDLEILELLAEKGTKLLAVGDDDQSIYSFRKAHPAGIRQFPSKYGIRAEHDYKLTTCHRCPQQIIEWASHVILGDTAREPRNLPAGRTGAPEGMRELLGFSGDISEARGVGGIVQWLRDDRQVPLSEILILTRTDYRGTFTKAVRDELGRREIPTSESGVVKSILAEPDNRRLLALVRLLIQRNESLAWWTLLMLTGGVGEKMVDFIIKRAIANGCTFGEEFLTRAQEYALGGPVGPGRIATDMRDDVCRMLDGISVPRAGSGVQWGNWISTLVQAGHLPNCSELFRQLLVQLDEVIEPAISLEQYLSHIQPLGEDMLRAKSDEVRVMTIMGSKGLTVRATIVVGAEDDLIPRHGQDPAEERRLLYVAMTRSREYLFLTWAGRRSGPPARAGRTNVGRRSPSQFLRGGPVESQDGRVFVAQLRQ